MIRKAEAIKALQQSCQVTRTYVLFGTKTCALGGLAVAAGLSHYGLQGGRIDGVIWEHFKLTAAERSMILALNDSVEDSMERRRELVITYVQSLPDDDIVPAAVAPVKPMTMPRRKRLQKIPPLVPATLEPTLVT